VFLNCPFDEAYKPLFAATVFTTVACGFRPRAALEDDGRGLMRFERLTELVKACDFGIHDLSRTESSADGLPRFNMPFELGLFLGARTYGGSRQKRKNTLVLVKERHILGKYLSDLAGVDPVPHGGTVEGMVDSVRGFFQRALAARASQPAKRLPGAAAIRTSFAAFQHALPKIAEAGGFDPDALDPLKSYVDFNHAVVDFLATEKS
jgi:hypothetical protein